jgi:hypothetical protein
MNEARAAQGPTEREPPTAALWVRRFDLRAGDPNSWRRLRLRVMGVEQLGATTAAAGRAARGVAARGSAADSARGNVRLG